MKFIKDAEIEEKVRNMIVRLVGPDQANSIEFGLLNYQDPELSFRMEVWFYSPSKHLIAIHSGVREMLLTTESEELVFASLSHEIGHIADVREIGPRVLTSLHEFDGGISRYFGLGRRLEIEVKSERLEEGDLILMVSDGVTKVFSTTEAANLILETFEKTGDTGMAVQELVTRSRSKKSVDDITAMLIEVIDE